MNEGFSFSNYGTFEPGLTSLTATGTTQATAAPLRSKYNRFTVVPPLAGCQLPAVVIQTVTEIVVINSGANLLYVYPPVGGTIDGLAVNAPASLTAGQVANYICYAPPAEPGTNWITSFQLQPGAPGAFRSGAGAPSNTLGQNGDYYLDTSTGNLYLKSGGSYSVVCQLATTSAPLIVTATGSITPRSVQDRFSDVINLLDYGIATDAAGAWNAALARLPTSSSYATGIKIVVPAGMYSVHGGPITKTVPANVTLTIEGQGRGVSGVYIGDDTDGFAFTLEAGAGLHMRSLAIFRGVASPASAHTALSVISDPAINASFTGSASFRDLLIRGNIGSSQWRNGMVLSGLTGVPIDNVTINGINTTGTDNGDAMLTLSGPNANMYGVAYIVTNSNIVGGSVGVLVNGYVQNVVISDTSVVGSYDNVRWLAVAANYAEQLSISNCAFNGSHRDIVATLANYVQVVNCTLLRLGGGGNWVGIDLEDSNWSQITGNMFLGLVSPTEFGVVVNSSTSASGANPNTITGNTFTSMGNAAVTLTGQTANTSVVGNTSTNCIAFLTTTLANVNPVVGNTFNGAPVQNVPATEIVVPPGGNIQAAINALPATGGKIMLSPNTTYVVTATITVTTPNVTISAPGWSTIVQRAPSFTNGTVISASSAATNFVCENFTLDGNHAAVNTSTMEMAVAGNRSLVRNMHIINSSSQGHLALSGVNSRATGNTITGLGTDLGIETGYGIWAINGQTVMIDHNTVTGTGIDGIGFDGSGSQVIGNRVSGCHCWAGGPGGQIGSYSTNATIGGAVIGNTVGAGGATTGNGIEAVMQGQTVSGNVVDGVAGYGILVSGSGQTITGNVVRNVGGATIDGIEVLAGITDFVITGNRIADMRATPVMRAGIWINTGASDRYTIAGNTISGSTQSAVVDGGTGHNKVIGHNAGLDSVVPQIISASPLALPPNPTIILLGSATVSAMTITNDATGRVCTLIPTGAVSFVAGATIANSFTCTANVPVLAVFDGVQWHFR